MEQDSKSRRSIAGGAEQRHGGQWKYRDEIDWRDLVALTELTGAAGENGKNGTDGKDGINGINGTDGKEIEIQKTDLYIQWRYEGGEWQNLVALADILGPSGQNGTNGEDGRTPELQVMAISCNGDTKAIPFGWICMIYPHWKVQTAKTAHAPDILQQTVEYTVGEHRFRSM